MPRKHRHQSDNPASETAAVRPSKSEMKRRMAAVAELVTRLLKLNQAQLAALGLDDETRQEIEVAAGLNGGARRRQLKYLTGQLSSADTEALTSELDRLERPHRVDVARFHKIEQLRDDLIAGNDEASTHIRQHHGEDCCADIEALAQAARRERPGAARALFRQLSKLDL